MAKASTPICALPDCEEEILPGRKYSSDECRKKNARRRHEEKNRPPQDPVEQRVAKEKERLHQKEMTRTLEELTRSAAKRQEYTSAIQSVLTPFEPSEVFPFPEHDTQTTVEWALEVCDWHVGQKTSLEHTGGLYEQTVEVVRAQVDKLLTAVQGIFYEARGKHVKRLWVPILGDIVEGDSMRPAQLREIQIPVVRQTIEGFDLLAYFLRSLLKLPGLEELIVDMVGGNHDRTTQKAGNAGLGESDYCDTYAWLIGEMLKRSFEGDPRVQVTNWDTFFGTREYAGLKHVFEHGSSIRTAGGSYGGVPFYPIVNAARQYESMLGGVDCVWLGHLHVPYHLPLGQEGHIIGNGSLPATSRFVQSRYKTLRRPQQWLVEFHRKHGATAFRPLYADINLPKPGEVWQAKHRV
jgi:hypothetical protein